MSAPSTAESLKARREALLTEAGKLLEKRANLAAKVKSSEAAYAAALGDGRTAPSTAAEAAYGEAAAAVAAVEVRLRAIRDGVVNLDLEIPTVEAAEAGALLPALKAEQRRAELDVMDAERRVLELRNILGRKAAEAHSASVRSHRTAARLVVVETSHYEPRNEPARDVGIETTLPVAEAWAAAGVGGAVTFKDPRRQGLALLAGGRHAAQG